MNTDIMFWWTGWAVWCAFSCILAFFTLVGGIFIVINTLRNLKSWAGIHIMRKAIDAGDWDAPERWPKIRNEHDTKVVMTWLRKVADAEMNNKNKER